MNLATGVRVGSYEILAPLGAGAMGEGWLAEDTRLKREVELKLLPAELTADADRVRRFEKEAQATSALSHPNIITVYANTEHRKSLFVCAGVRGLWVDPGQYENASKKSTRPRRSRTKHPGNETSDASQTSEK